MNDIVKIKLKIILQIFYCFFTFMTLFFEHLHCTLQTRYKVQHLYSKEVITFVRRITISCAILVGLVILLISTNMATQDAKIVRVKKGIFFVVEDKQLYKNVFHLVQDLITRNGKKIKLPWSTYLYNNNMFVSCGQCLTRSLETNGV